MTNTSAHDTPSPQNSPDLIDADSGRRNSRRHRRFSVTAVASVTDNSGITETATLVNLSVSGLMLHVPITPNLSVGHKVQVVFLRTSQTGIVRHVSSARYGVLLGIEFDLLSEPDQPGHVLEQGLTSSNGFSLTCAIA